jgi:uncharacterized protein YodC (DUF2158 family)
MAASTFKTGDVVQLKSGGHKMTVQAPSTIPDHVFCEWLDSDGNPHGQPFHRDMLVKADDEQS